MKRLAVLIGLLMVFVTGYAVATQTALSEAIAQDQRTIAVLVKFWPTDYTGQKEHLSEGEVCSYINALSDIWPVSKQVVVSDAAGVIVGTVDLFDVFDGPDDIISPPDETQPGIVDDGGYVW